LYILFNREIKFSLAEQSAHKLILFTVGGFIFLIAAVLTTIFIDDINLLAVRQEINSLIIEEAPIVLFQEAIFRGILFMYLKDINLNDSKVLFVTTILFWVTHIHYWTEETAIGFWIVIPAVGLLFGYVAMRSKSIAISSIVHALYNTFSQLLSLIW
jgi:membrane protease YdiL (CAAX protease family)